MKWINLADDAEKILKEIDKDAGIKNPFIDTENKYRDLIFYLIEHLRSEE